MPTSTLRTCTACTLSMPIKAFGWYKVGKRMVYYAICRACIRVQPISMQMPDDHKRCKKCQQVVPISRFSMRAYGTALHRRGVCMDCRNAMNIAARRRSPERLVQYNKYRRIWRQQHSAVQKAVEKDSHLYRTYGITLADYSAMLNAQCGKCAICKRSDPNHQKHNFYHVDHCHITGKVRGLLCSTCNVALGGFGDDCATLRAALVYLERHVNG